MFDPSGEWPAWVKSVASAARTAFPATAPGCLVGWGADEVNNFRVWSNPSTAADKFVAGLNIVPGSTLLTTVMYAGIHGAEHLTGATLFLD